MEIAKLLRDIHVTEAKLTNEHVTGITSDTRRVKGGEMLICIRGLHHDGHSYMAEGVNRGAAVVLAETREGLPEGTDYILTPDTRLAEALIWNNRYDRPAEKMRKVGVTGTAGKTSTAYLLRDLLMADGKRPGMLTTIRTMADNEEIPIPAGGSSVADAAGAMTTPDPEYFYGAVARMRERGCDTLIYEASSHALDLHKTDGIRPDFALFTNLTPEHMDYHGTMENYLAAKARLFSMAETGIINGDDPYAKALTEYAPDCRFLTCTADPEKFQICDAAAMRFTSHGADGISFLYCGRDAIFRICTPLTGRYSVTNAMLAVTCALQMGADPLTVKEAMLYTISPPEGRMERLALGKAVPFTVFIDYAHTPAALEQVLRTARETNPAKLTVLFGCGGDRDRNKRPLMGNIAQRYADKVVLADDNPRTEDPQIILSEILAGMENPPAAVIPDRREAIRQVIREAEAGEMILLCGKGHEKYEIRGNVRTPFDEAAIVREAVSARADCRKDP